MWEDSSNGISDRILIYNIKVELVLDKVRLALKIQQEYDFRIYYQ